jgi:chemotaxis protein MotB
MSEKRSAMEPEEEHENAERWLLTYSDMITLLVCFFILMYSMSVLNLAKFQKLAVSIRGGFNGPMKTHGGVSIIEKGQVSTLQDPAAEQIDKTVKELAPMAQHVGHNAEIAPPLEGSKEAVRKAEQLLGMKGRVKITPNNRGWVVELVGDEIFFDKDSDQLTDKAHLALIALGPTFNEVREVAVEGFSSESAKGGFSLSSRRALAVVGALQEGCVNEDKMSATGYGVHAPDELGGRDYVRIALRR